MASIVPYNGKYRVFLKAGKKRKTKVCRTHREAVKWAAQWGEKLESEETPKIPFSDVLERYIEEVSKFKKGSRWEILRLRALQKDPLGSVPLPDLSPKHFSSWRDRRLGAVKSSTVNREWNLLSHVISVAIKDWEWLKENPLSNVRRPENPEPRTRRPTEQEIESLLVCLGYSRDSQPKSISERVGAAYLFAIETAMRCGEICRLNRDMVDTSKRICRLPGDITKTGKPRTVPLSKEAMRILEQVGFNFNLKSSQVDINFRKARDRAGIEDLTFHDARREALTRLSKKVDALTLARISGHRDLKVLLQVYYTPDLSGELLD